MALIKIYNIAIGGVLCNCENMKIACNLKPASWLGDIILDFFLASVVLVLTLNLL